MKTDQDATPSYWTLLTSAMGYESSTLLTPVSLGAILLFLGLANPPKLQAKENVTYETLAPILVEKCVMCHSGDSAPAGLKLDSFDSLLNGGIRGPVVKAGDPAASELVRRLKGSSLPRMPMTGPPFLSDSQIAMFEDWIANGLKRGDATKLEKPRSVQPPRPKPGEAVTYLHVAPILAARCAKCHTDEGLMGGAPEGYRLTSYEATLATSDRVRVVPGAPKASELVRRIRGQARPRMPLDGPPYLTDEETRLIEDWVAQGARSAEGRAAVVPKGAAVRLHGTLGPNWQLDGFPLAVGARTRIDKSPAPGDHVEVRGRLGEAATVEVERLRRR